MMTFDEFASAGVRLRNSWVRSSGLSIYVRRPTGYSHNADFELAALEADEPGNGALTSFLDTKVETFSFYLENIVNERLIAFLGRRGYRVIGDAAHSLDVGMITARCWHIRDA